MLLPPELPLLAGPPERDAPELPELPYPPNPPKLPELREPPELPKPPKLPVLRVPPELPELPKPPNPPKLPELRELLPPLKLPLLMPPELLPPELLPKPPPELRPPENPLRAIVVLRKISVAFDAYCRARSGRYSAASISRARPVISVNRFRCSSAGHPSFSSPLRIRQTQLFPAVPGVFIRAQLSRPSRS